jgi:Ca-activated chloride channel family protein
MRYADPQWLDWLWGLIPLAAALLAAAVWHGRRLARITRSDSIRQRLLANVSYAKKALAGVLLLGSMAGCLLALARPQWGTRMENVVRRGVDVIIAVDTSLSMNTPDVPPNRIGMAKEELRALLETLGDARVGIISFAGSAFLQCPLTIDRSAAAMFLELMETGLIPDPGTDIGSAIALARETFQRHQQKYKVLILLTDGENLSGDPEREARRAGEEGVVIFTIGVGTPAGQPIPVLDEQGAVVDFKRDAGGAPVISRLDEETLVAIARITGGQSYRASILEDEVAVLAGRIDGMEKKELQSRMTRRYLDRFQIPLLAAVLCLVAEGMLSDGRRSFRRLLQDLGDCRDNLRLRRKQILRAETVNQDVGLTESARREAP